jgi:hypothetical protein
MPRVALARHDDVGHRVLVTDGHAILVGGQGQGQFSFPGRGVANGRLVRLIEAEQTWHRPSKARRPEGAPRRRPICAWRRRHDPCLREMPSPLVRLPANGWRGRRATELDPDAGSGRSQASPIARNLTLDRTLTLASRQTRDATSVQSNGGCRYVTPGSGTAPWRCARARSRGGRIWAQIGTPVPSPPRRQ